MRRPASRPTLARLWTLALALLGLCALAAGAGARSGEAESAAGFILDTGEGEPRYVVVTFAGERMPAVDLLRAAELDAVTVDFGGLGEAVCAIDRTGCDVSACRQRLCQTGDPESPFWQYWEQDDAGTWALSPLGASHAEVADGDVAAWVWTGVAPELASITWEELATRAGAPLDVTTGDVGGEPRVFVSGAGAGGAEGGSLASTLASVGVIAVLGVAGGWLVRRRRAAAAPG